MIRLILAILLIGSTAWAGQGMGPGPGTYSGAAAPPPSSLGLYSNQAAILNPTTYKYSSASAVEFTDTTQQMYRQITFPADGTFTFIRWFNTATLAFAGAVDKSCEIVAFGQGGANGAITSWDYQFVYGFGTNGTAGVDGFAIGSPEAPSVKVSSSTLSANTWYKVQVEIQNDSGMEATYRRITVYSATGSTLYQSTWDYMPTYLGGRTEWSILGRSGVAGDFFFDGVNDSI